MQSGANTKQDDENDSDDVFAAAIRNQISIAIEQAQVIIFMVDVTTGITDLDQKVAAILDQCLMRGIDNV